MMNDIQGVEIIARGKTKVYLPEGFEVSKDEDPQAFENAVCKGEN
jgi:hypothetical protein